MRISDVSSDGALPIAAVGLDLRFAGTAEEAETAALALEVGPAAHQTPRLIIEMRKLDLQAALGRRGAFAEDFEDQAGAVDHLRAKRRFEIALLNRAERRIDDDKLDAFRCDIGRDRVDLADAEQGRRPRLAQAQRVDGNDVEPDREREPPRLLRTRVRSEEH